MGEICRTMINQNEYRVTLRTVLKDYIPHQLLQDVDEEKSQKFEGIELIQFYMDNSNNKLRVYRSAEFLDESLKTYSNFPLRRNRFPVTDFPPFLTVPENFMSVAGTFLLCKQDLLDHLQSAVYSYYKGKEMPSNLREYMENHVKRLAGCYEFIEFRPDIVGEAILKSIPSDNYVEVFEKLITKYPTNFLPNSETKDPNATVVVRLFPVGYQKFVMESEIFNAINQNHPNRIPLKSLDKDGFLRTIEMRRMIEMFRGLLSGIHFLTWEVDRAQQVPVPIATPYGDHCFTAADALITTFSYMINVLNVFQKITPDKWHMVTDFMTKLKKYIRLDVKCMYFIKLDVLKEMKMDADEFFKPLEHIRCNSIRDVGPNGFTADDLKEELRYLGLTAIFPEITLNLNKIISQKQPDKSICLKTYDMIEIVERCQLICLFKRFPSMNNFLHLQNMCYHMPYVDCDMCMGVRREIVENEFPSRLKTLKTSKDTVEEEKDVLKKLKEKEEEIEKMKDVQNDRESVYTRLLFEKDRSIGNMVRYRQMDTEAFRAKIQKLTETNAGLESNVADLETKLKKSQRETENVQKKVKKLDEKAKKVEDLEKKMKEMQKKMEYMRTSNMRSIEEKEKEIEDSRVSNTKELEKKDTEIEGLKERNKEIVKEVEKLKQENLESIKRKDEEIGKMKKENAKVNRNRTRQIDQLKGNIVEKEEVETQMRRENKELIKKIQDLEQENEGSADHFEAQLVEKDTLIKELRESNAKQILEKNQSNKEMKQKILKVSDEYKNQLNSILNELLPSEPNIVRSELMGLQKIKDTMYSVSVLEMALEMKGMLISLSNKPEIHQMAIYEHQQYEGKLRNYQQEVEKRIQLLKKSDDVTALPPLPEFPSFSDRFIQEYWLEVDKQKTSGELQDSECLFCFIEMKSEEKTLTCEHCRKITHLECASKWLKIHRSCPHCRREQLDPNEFPILQ